MESKTFTLAELAEITESTLIGDPKWVISHVADLESAGPQDASFLANPRYEQAMRQSQAGVVFVNATTPLVDGKNFLVHESPSSAFQKLIEIFFGEKQERSGFEGIHPTAVIHPTAKIGTGVSIGPYTVIDKHVVIGEGTFIGAGSYIGPYTNVGNECTLHPRVTIRECCSVGNRVILQPGVVIGSCGFGYITDQKGQHVKLNQLGTVRIDDDVELGANTTIDRARFKTTHIKRGSKLDNLVQIGHGVTVGEHNIIVSQTGIAGSTETGRHVILAGQVAVAGHIKLADQVVVTGKSGVSKSISKAGNYGGIPVLPLPEYNRMSVHLRNIEKYVKEIKELKDRVGKLELE